MTTPVTIVEVPEGTAAVLRDLASVDGPGWLAELGAALVASPVAALLDDARLVVRNGPRVLLGVFGDLDAADLSRLDALRTQLIELPARLRFLAWPEVEATVDVLAERLSARLGDDLATTTALAIPRGGHVVLGLLAVRLGLPAAALGDVRGDRPLLLVDDCLLSGANLRRWIGRIDHPDIVVAALAAHPDLPPEVEADEHRVRAVVTAVDLHDHAPALHGASYAAWRRRWAARRPEDYWTGHADLVAFPWGEPDTTYWNPVTACSEPGWRLLPASRCLKNRPPPGVAPQVVQVASEGPGPLRASPDVVWHVEGDDVTVASARHGGLLLSGTAGAMFLALLAEGTVEGAANALAARYLEDRVRIAGDARALADDLRQRGMLTAVQF